MHRVQPGFLAGVVEGFYGVPWTPAERLGVYAWMAEWGLNTYVYAPKDDLKHRAIWRQPYDEAEARALGGLVRACRGLGLRFVYALSPGLSIRYSDEADVGALTARFEQIRRLGVEDFALLFDDIPDRLAAEDLQRWGSLAAAQAQLSNRIFDWVRSHAPDGRLLLCPTPYCGRMAAAGHGGGDYLGVLGRGLAAGIDVFWTGPEIISREVTPGHVREVGALLRRKPLLWDNLHANDYDGRRFYCGPYAGRSPELLEEVSGVLSNPNCEMPLNYVPLRTLAEFVRREGVWEPRRAYRDALEAWLPRFETVSEGICLEDLMTFGDCYYLPHEDGAEAEALLEDVRTLLGARGPVPPAVLESFRHRARILRETCVRLVDLRDRPLFHALSRRVWELREELDLLERCIGGWSAAGDARLPARSDFHLPLTYRGGLVARLQRLLVQHGDGTFTPAEPGRGTP